VDRRRFLALGAAAPLALRATLAAAARPPYALVTCDDTARLALVDLGAFRVVRYVDVAADPRSIELVGSRAVVCHTAIGAVSVVDGRGRVLHVLRDFVEPRYTAAHPDGRRAFVTDSGHSSVTAIDVVRGTVIGRVRLKEWARHLSLDPAGRTLWVGMSNASSDVAVVNAKRLRHIASVTPGFGAHDVGWLPGGREVWVTSGDRRETAIFDRAGRRRLTLAAGLAPQHVTFARDVAFVTSGDSGTLSVHRLSDGRVLRTTPIELGSYNVQYGGERVVTASLERGTLTVLDRGGRKLAVIQVSGSCHDACITSY
jgi:DNA-binding beta-propeller fold protein YncE